MLDIKDPLQLIEKSSPYNGGSEFPFSLYEWSFTIYPMSYNRNYFFYAYFMLIIERIFLAF